MFTDEIGKVFFHGMATSIIYLTLYLDFALEILAIAARLEKETGHMDWENCCYREITGW